MAKFCFMFDFFVNYSLSFYQISYHEKVAILIVSIFQENYCHLFNKKNMGDYYLSKYVPHLFYSFNNKNYNYFCLYWIISIVLKYFQRCSVQLQSIFLFSLLDSINSRLRVYYIKFQFNFEHNFMVIIYKIRIIFIFGISTK